MMLMLMRRMISARIGDGNSDNRVRYQTMMSDGNESDSDGVDVDHDDDVDDE